MLSELFREDPCESAYHSELLEFRCKPVIIFSIKQSVGSAGTSPIKIQWQIRNPWIADQRGEWSEQNAAFEGVDMESPRSGPSLGAEAALNFELASPAGLW